MNLSRRLLAPGDGLRQWWAGLGRVQKWGFGVLASGCWRCCRCTRRLSSTLRASASAAPWRSSRWSRSSRSASTWWSVRPACSTSATSASTPSAPTPSPCSPARTARGTRWAPTGFFSQDWAWLSCVPLAMAFTALAGLILGTPTLRLRGDYLAIVTLGFGEIIRLLADNLSDITNGSRGLNEVAYPRLGESEKLPERRLLQRQLRRVTPTTAPGGSGWAWC